MPTVRIRTHDPDAVSFFTAKLADCGFDVEFAAPGQRVRGDVDLEITVNYTSKSSAARKNTRNSVPLIRPSAPERRIEWTTPYHAEAPELADEFPNSRGGRSDVSKDRELARILAGGPKRGEMFVIGIQGQQDQQAVPVNTEALEAPLPVPEPALAIQPVEARPKPSETSSRSRNRHTPTRSSAVLRGSVLQRYSASATAIILTAAIALFYLSLFGNPNYAPENSRLSTMPSRKNISAAPVTQPLQPATSTNSESDDEKSDLISHSSNSDPKQTRQIGAGHRPEEYEEPEVVVRHFSTTTNGKTAKQSSDRN